MGRKKNRDTRIKDEYGRLKELFADVPKNKQELCQGLLENAAFMKVALDDLRKVVTEEGAIKECVNGNGFTVLQEHPAQKSYNSMINRYSSVIADLAKILPESSGSSKLAAFLESE